MEKYIKLNNEEDGENEHYAQQAVLDVSAELKRNQARDRLKQLIGQLQDFVQPKKNIHTEIKTKTTSFFSAFNRLKLLAKDIKVPADRAPKAVYTQKTPHIQTITETTSAIGTESDTDVESVSEGKRNVKRKLPKSPGSGNKETKQR